MTRYQRAPYIDQYVEDGEMAVMLTDMRVVAVSTVAAAALQAIGDGRADLAAITKGLAQAGFEAPATDGVASVSGLMTVLEGANLLTLIGNDPGLG